MKLLSLIEIMNEDAAGDVEMLQQAREICQGVLTVVNQFVTDEFIAEVINNKYDYLHPVAVDDEDEDSDSILSMQKGMLYINLKALMEYCDISDKGFANFKPYGNLLIFFGKHPTLNVSGSYSQNSIEMYINFDIKNNPHTRDLVQAIETCELTLIHELVHHFDDIRSNNKVFNNAKKYTGDNTMEIYSKPHEINAMFIEFIDRTLRSLADGELYHRGMKFEEFFSRAFENASSTLKDVYNQNPAIQKTITKRFYKIYDSMLRRGDVTGPSRETGRFKFYSTEK